MRKESAATEIVGFIIILAIVIMGCVIWCVIAVPIQGENKELTHNDEVLLEMAELKYGLDTLLIDQILFSTRTSFISNSPKGDKNMITLLPELSNIFSTGTVTVERGDKLDDNTYKLKITFTSQNMYAKNVEIVYDGGSLTSTGGYKVLSEIKASDDIRLISAVPSDFSPIGLSGNDFSVIIFRLDEIKTIGTDRVGVFNIEVRGTYYA